MGYILLLPLREYSLQLARAGMFCDFGSCKVSLNKHIEKLCQEVSQEKDGEKLLSLVDQLNKELEHISETLDENKRESANSKLAQPKTNNAA